MAEFPTKTSGNGPELIDEIHARLNAGGVVQMTTHTRSVIFGHPSHVARFAVVGGDPCVKEGKRFASIRHASVRFGRRVKGATS